VTAEY